MIERALNVERHHLLYCFMRSIESVVFESGLIDPDHSKDINTAKCVDLFVSGYVEPMNCFVMRDIFTDFLSSERVKTILKSVAVKIEEYRIMSKFDSLQAQNQGNGANPIRDNSAQSYYTIYQKPLILELSSIREKIASVTDCLTKMVDIELCAVIAVLMLVLGFPYDDHAMGYIFGSDYYLFSGDVIQSGRGILGGPNLGSVYRLPVEAYTVYAKGGWFRARDALLTYMMKPEELWLIIARLSEVTSHEERGPWEKPPLYTLDGSTLRNGIKVSWKPSIIRSIIDDSAPLPLSSDDTYSINALSHTMTSKGSSADDKTTENAIRSLFGSCPVLYSVLSRDGKYIRKTGLESLDISDRPSTTQNEQPPWYRNLAFSSSFLDDPFPSVNVPSIGSDERSLFSELVKKLVEDLSLAARPGGVLSRGRSLLPEAVARLSETILDECTPYLRYAIGSLNKSTLPEKGHIAPRKVDDHRSPPPPLLEKGMDIKRMLSPYKGGGSKETNGYEDEMRTIRLQIALGPESYNLEKTSWLFTSYSSDGRIIADNEKVPYCNPFLDETPLEHGLYSSDMKGILVSQGRWGSIDWNRTMWTFKIPGMIDASVSDSLSGFCHLLIESNYIGSDPSYFSALYERLLANSFKYNSPEDAPLSPGSLSVKLLRGWMLNSRIIALGEYLSRNRMKATAQVGDGLLISGGNSLRVTKYSPVNSLAVSRAHIAKSDLTWSREWRWKHFVHSYRQCIKSSSEYDPSSTISRLGELYSDVIEYGEREQKQRESFKEGDKKVYVFTSEHESLIADAIGEWRSAKNLQRRVSDTDHEWSLERLTEWIRLVELCLKKMDIILPALVANRTRRVDALSKDKSSGDSIRESPNKDYQDEKSKRRMRANESKVQSELNLSKHKSALLIFDKFRDQMSEWHHVLYILESCGISFMRQYTSESPPGVSKGEIKSIASVLVGPNLSRENNLTDGILMKHITPDGLGFEYIYTNILDFFAMVKDEFKKTRDTILKSLRIDQSVAMETEHFYGAMFSIFMAKLVSVYKTFGDNIYTRIEILRLLTHDVPLLIYSIETTLRSKLKTHTLEILYLQDKRCFSNVENMNGEGDWWVREEIDELFASLETSRVTGYCRVMCQILAESCREDFMPQTRNNTKTAEPNKTASDQPKRPFSDKQNGSSNVSSDSSKETKSSIETKHIFELIQDSDASKILRNLCFYLVYTHNADPLPFYFIRCHYSAYNILYSDMTQYLYKPVKGWEAPTIVASDILYNDTKSQLHPRDTLKRAFMIFTQMEQLLINGLHQHEIEDTLIDTIRWRSANKGRAEFYDLVNHKASENVVFSFNRGNDDWVFKSGRSGETFKEKHKKKSENKAGTLLVDDNRLGRIEKAFRLRTMHNFTRMASEMASVRRMQIQFNSFKSRRNRPAAHNTDLEKGADPLFSPLEGWIDNVIRISFYSDSTAAHKGSNPPTDTI